MRPPGVRQRVKELLNEEWNHVHSRPEHLLRVNLTSFVTLSARLRYYDLPGTAVLKRYQEVRDHLDDTSQTLTHSDFENKSISCVDQLLPEIGEIARKQIEDITLDDEDAAREPLLRIPPTVLLGESGPGCHFHLICWNEANSLVEGFQTPYRAARQIANMGFHEPDDPYGLIDPLADLAMRYEDHPDERGKIAEEITGRLAAYLSRTPWGAS